MIAMRMPVLSRLSAQPAIRPAGGRSFGALLAALALAAALAACVPVGGYDDYGFGSSSYVGYGVGYGGWGPDYRVGPYFGPGYRRGPRGWDRGRPGRMPFIPRGRPGGRFGPERGFGRGPGRR